MHSLDQLQALLFIEEVQLSTLLDAVVYSTVQYCNHLPVSSRYLSNKSHCHTNGHLGVLGCVGHLLGCVLGVIHKKSVMQMVIWESLGALGIFLGVSWV